MKSSTILKGIAAFALTLFFFLINNYASATDGTGVVTVTAINGGSCLGFTAGSGNGPDNWEVVEGGSYTMTISGVTECTGDAITVFIQSSNTGNFCFNATGGGGTYSGSFTVPDPACFTMPISYKCGADQPCDNSDTYNADGPSSTGAVHLRSAIFDGSCNVTGEDTVCTACVCEPPTGITITSIGNDQVQVCWNSQPCATGYIVQYQWRGHENWNTIEVSAPDTCVVIDLLGHVFITVQVATVCQDGSVTAYAQAGTYKYDGACTAPSTLTTTNVTATSATLNWTPGTTTSTQRLRYGVDGSGSTYVIGVPKAQGSYTLTGLLPSTTYQWKVRGDCWSGSKKFTTTAQKTYSISGSVEMNVYPNPASDHLFVSIEMDPTEIGEGTVQLVNMMGQLIYSTNTSISNGSVLELPLDDKIASGLYTVRVITNDKTFEQRILINK